MSDAAVLRAQRSPLALADLPPGVLARDALLVAGFVEALAQISIHLSFTRVPITGQTLGVLLADRALAGAGPVPPWSCPPGPTGVPACRVVVAQSLLDHLSLIEALKERSHLLRRRSGHDALSLIEFGPHAARQRRPGARGSRRRPRSWGSRTSARPHGADRSGSRGKTDTTKLQAMLTQAKPEIMRRRHLPVPEQGKMTGICAGAPARAVPTATRHCGPCGGRSGRRFTSPRHYRTARHRAGIPVIARADWMFLLRKEMAK